MIHFEVDSLKESNHGLQVPGRVHEGTIRLGSIFRSIIQENTVVPSQQMSLKVVNIIAYRHSLDELPEGMTGELTVIGDGAEALRASTFPVIIAGVE